MISQNNKKESYNHAIFESVMESNKEFISKFNSVELPLKNSITGNKREDAILFNIYKLIVFKRNNLFEILERPYFKIKDLFSIPFFPVNMFGDAFTVRHRWDYFFTTLDVAKVFTFQVINITLKDRYKLVVIEQPGHFYKLDDLDIVMYLPKTPEENQYLNNQELKAGEYIRAAVKHADYTLRHIYVTLNPVFSKNQIYPLGQISKEELPIWLENENKNMSFNDYLCQFGSLENLLWSEAFGNLKFDLERICSFLDNWNGKEFPAPQCVPVVRELRKSNVCEMAYQLASDLQKKNAPPNEAIDILSKALELYPNCTPNRLLRASLYKMAGNIHKAVLDLEEVIKIEPDNAEAKIQLSEVLFTAARAHVNQNNIKFAKEALRVVVTLNETNEEAVSILSNIDQQIESDEENLDSRPSTSHQEEYGPYSPTDDHRQKCESFLKSINCPGTPPRRHKKSYKHHSSHHESPKKKSYVKKHKDRYD